MPARRRWSILAICSSSLFLVSLDGTIVNVALPSIGRELQAGVSTLQWTVDSYLLVLASLLLLSGSLADRFGRRTVFTVGVSLFTAGSILCSMARTDGWLICFRMIQAAGGSAMTPVALAIVTNVFLDPTERAKAIGIWSAISGLGMAIGPLLGGILVDAVGWRAIFWLNIPIGIAVVVCTLTLIPESRAKNPRPLDPVGQILVIAACVALVFTVIEAPGWGWSWPIITSALVAVGAFAGLLLFERRRPAPLVPLDLFRQRTFVAAFSIAILGFVTLNGMLFVNTLYLQEIRGVTASEAGVLTLPLAVTILIAAPLSSRLMVRSGVGRPLSLAGAILTAASLLLLVTTTWDLSLVFLLIAYALFGLGYGMINAPVNDTAVSDLPIDRSGIAAALVSTSKHVGAALGVAVAGAVVSARAGESLDQAINSNGWIVWTILAAVGVGIITVASALPPRFLAGDQPTCAQPTPPVPVQRPTR